MVHATNIYDTKGGIPTAKRAYERYPSVQKACADAGYRGAFVSDLKEQLDLDVDISEKINPHQKETLLEFYRKKVSLFCTSPFDNQGFP